MMEELEQVTVPAGRGPMKIIKAGVIICPSDILTSVRLKICQLDNHSLVSFYLWP